MTKESKKLIVIDSNSIIHRAFHALPPLSSKEHGIVNAVYGFLLVFLKATKEFNPDYIVATFDLHAPTFRHERHKDYKAKRPKAPDELYNQIPKIKEFLKAFNVAIFEKEGFEADDIIGTVSRLAPKKQVIPKIETIILSGDKDIFQLVNKNTKIFFLRKGVKDTILCDEDSVREKYEGLNPNQLVSYKALRGDPSDNIPGVTGIGRKTAIELISKFNSVEDLYEALETRGSSLVEDIRPRIKDLLIQYKEQAFLSRDLAQIDTNVPLDFNLKECEWGEYDQNKVRDMLASFEFNSLLSRISGFKKTKDDDKINQPSDNQQKQLF